MLYIFPLILLMQTANVIAQDFANNQNIWLASVISIYEENMKKAEADIIRCHQGIKKCEESISTSKDIIHSARETNDTQTEKIAQEALQKAQSNKAKYEKLLHFANTLKAQSVKNLDTVKKLLNQPSLKNTPISAVTIKRSGTVTVQKPNGQILNLDESINIFFEDGDVISTSNNSKIELQLFDGRCNAIVGENSAIKLVKSDDNKDMINLSHGKIKLEIAKQEDIEKRLRSYKETKSSDDNYSKQFELWINKTLKKIGKRFEVRTTTFSGAVRGTTFLVDIVDSTKTEVVVLEGTVEIQSLIDSSSISISANQKVIVNNKGVFSAIQNINLSNYQKWWKDEDQ